MKNLLLLMLLPVALLTACSSSKVSKSDKEQNPEHLGTVSTPAPVVIYKTVADFSKNVPITMNAEKTEISSYPAPKDVAPGGNPAYPVALAEGFLLDKRGITANSVFLDYTYTEYMALQKTPSIEELTAHILEKNPFEVIYNCGNRGMYPNLVEDLNALITAGDFSKFTKE